MKKIILAGLLALTAGAASAGSLVIFNDSDAIIEVYTGHTLPGAVSPHLGIPSGSWLRFFNKELGKEDLNVTVVSPHPALIGYGWQNIPVPEVGHKKLTYTGTVFNLQLSEGTCDTVCIAGPDIYKNGMWPVDSEYQ